MTNSFFREEDDAQLDDNSLSMWLVAAQGEELYWIHEMSEDPIPEDVGERDQLDYPHNQFPMP